MRGLANNSAVPHVAVTAPTADSHSFDYEEGFIELCLDLHRFATGLSAPEIRFQSDI